MRPAPRLLAPAVLLLLATSAGASSSGRVGRSLPDYAGCGNCHGNESTQVTVLLDGPTTVDAGGTYAYEVRLARGPLLAGGFNAAANTGTLVPGDGSKLMNRELTHSSPKAPDASQAEVRFPFQWVAPPYAGAAVLTAVANSVNLSNTPEGDAWGRATPLEVTVLGPEAPDAGTPPLPTPDAGTPTPGTPDDEEPGQGSDEDTGGCAAASSVGAWPALLLLAAMALRPRRRCRR